MSEASRRPEPAPVPAEESAGPPEVVVLVGLQASGKSTLYRARFSGTHALVSRDLFRNNRRPARRQRELLAEALSRGRSVVVDTPTRPSPTAQRCWGWRASAVRGRRASTSSPTWAPRSRAARRDGRARVPVPAILATRKRLEPPSLAEGFDRLFEVEPDGQGSFRVREVTR